MINCIKCKGRMWYVMDKYIPLFHSHGETRRAKWLNNVILCPYCGIRFNVHTKREVSQ